MDASRCVPEAGWCRRTASRSSPNCPELSCPFRVTEPASELRRAVRVHARAAPRRRTGELQADPGARGGGVAGRAGVEEGHVEAHAFGAAEADGLGDGRGDAGTVERSLGVEEPSMSPR